MNSTLESALGRIASLPDSEQERLARWLVAELDDELEWQTKFQKSGPLLQELADEALEEHQRGETRAFPGLND